MTPDHALFSIIYLIYGLAFFCMGLAVLLEMRAGSGYLHLRTALRPLAGFGLLHGGHEWLEMLLALDQIPMQSQIEPVWVGIRIGMLAFSFLSLAAFGAALLSQEQWWRLGSMAIPLAMALVWAIGSFVLLTQYGVGQSLIAASEAWTRYMLGAPASLLACTGLIRQQYAFRRAGLVKFGRDSLWAAIGFAWYGAVGQIVVGASPLPPSNVINQELFLMATGVPIQLVRAAAAVLASVFVIRFLQAFEAEMEAQILQLRSDQVREAEQREHLRRELLGQVVAAQEAERRRLGRELHDDAGQALTAVGLGLRAAGRKIAGESGSVKGDLRHLELLVDRALEDLQRVIADLRPTHLDDLGLPAALRWYADQLDRRGALSVELQVQGEPNEVDPAVTTALFRVAQEALTNVIKHASTDQARLSLVYDGKQVRLNVGDDGRGFDPALAGASGRPTWGLLGMEERASLLGGHLQVESAPGEGTTIEVTIPYHKRQEVGSGNSSAAR